MTSQYILERLKQGGIDTERIALENFEASPSHLKAYNRIDICLDTFPFNGITTTCEAIWMGVPVVTLAGTAYAARGAVSILSNVGLQELVATTQEEYVHLAVNLARDIMKLQNLRQSLRDRIAHSPITNAELFTAHLETCYRAVWRKWCTSGGAKPVPRFK
jgi:predicted O-linked N-acetylglucosamine transferase (SPINDLY family)